MDVKFHIDRHFLFLHGTNLAVFTERILRNTMRNPNFPKPEPLWDNLRSELKILTNVLNDPFLKRKDRTDAVRAKEVAVLNSLEKLAALVEGNVRFKSDALSTGFHLHADQAKNDTRRRQRMSVKLQRLATA